MDYQDHQTPHFYPDYEQIDKTKLMKMLLIKLIFGIIVLLNLFPAQAQTLTFDKTEYYSGMSMNVSTSLSSSATPRLITWDEATATTQADILIDQFTGTALSSSWTATNITVSNPNVPAGTITLRSTTPAPTLTRAVSFQGNAYRYVYIRYRVSSGTAATTLTVSTAINNTTTYASCGTSSLTMNGNWSVVELDLNNIINWNRNITGFRLGWNVTAISLQVDYILITNRKRVADNNFNPNAPTWPTTPLLTNSYTAPTVSSNTSYNYAARYEEGTNAITATGSVQIKPAPAWATTATWDGTSVADRYGSYNTLTGFTGAGSGTATDPYQIHYPAQLALLRQQVANGTAPVDTYYKLGGDLNMGSTNFVIGNATTPFSGNFNGAGRKITLGKNSSGLFAFLQGGTKTELGVTTPYTATIQNLGVTGAITPASSSDSIIGGIANLASSNSIITACYNEATLTGTTALKTAGGIVGKIDANYGRVAISYCYNKGAISAPTNNNIGGIAGSILNTGGENSTATIENCFNFATVTGYNYVGGLAGYVETDQSNTHRIELNNSYNAATITGNNYVGGLAGALWSAKKGGGLLSVIGCYNTGSIVGADYIGGIAGDLRRFTDVSGSAVRLQYVWSGASVTATGSRKGAIAGDAFNATLYENYYDLQIASQLRAINSLDVTGVSAKTYTQTMQQAFAWSQFENHYYHAFGYYPQLNVMRNYTNSEAPAFAVNVRNASVLSVIQLYLGATEGPTSVKENFPVPTKNELGDAITWSFNPTSTLLGADGIVQLSTLATPHVLNMEATANGFIRKFTLQNMKTQASTRPAWSYATRTWGATTETAEAGAEYGYYNSATNTFLDAGTGAPLDPYTIYYPAQWKALADRVAAGTEPAGRFYVIKNSLNFGRLNFPSIGTSANPFRGNLHGGGNELNGVNIVNSGGVFGVINGGKISYMGIGKNAAINLNGMGGSIAGVLIDGTISDCYNLAKVISSGDIVGGLIGEAQGNSLIQNCFNRGEVWAGSTQSNWKNIAGGIAGQISGATQILNCFNTGYVQGLSNLGGIVGVMKDANTQWSVAVKNCYNVGALLTTGSNIGGIAGSTTTNCNVSNCFNSSPIIHQNGTDPQGLYRGSIVGNNGGGLGSNYYDLRIGNYSGVGYSTGVGRDISGVGGYTTIQIVANQNINAGVRNAGIESANSVVQWQAISGYNPQLLYFYNGGEVDGYLLGVNAWKDKLRVNSGLAALTLNFNGKPFSDVTADLTVMLVLPTSEGLAVSWVGDAGVDINGAQVALPLVTTPTFTQLQTIRNEDISRTLHFYNNKHVLSTRPFWAYTNRAWGGNSVDASGNSLAINGVQEVATAMQMGYWNETTGMFDGSGSGLTPQDPITIYYPAQLAFIAAQVNKGNSAALENQLCAKNINGTTYYGYAERYITLMADLDMNGVDAQNVPKGINYSFTPIGLGIKYPGDLAHPEADIFRGNFNGNGYAIQNIYITDNQKYIDSNAKDIALFGVVNGAIKGNYAFDAVVRYVSTDRGIISSTGDNLRTAGIVAMLGEYSTAANLVNSAAVTATGTNVVAGGIVAESHTTLTNVMNVANVTALQSSAAGGIVGKLSALSTLPNSNISVLQAQNAGLVTGMQHVGGIVGMGVADLNRELSILYAFNMHAISGSSYVGGVAGALSGSGKTVLNGTFSMAPIGGNGTFAGAVLGAITSSVSTISANYYVEQYSRYAGYGSASGYGTALAGITPLTGITALFEPATLPAGFDATKWSKAARYVPELRCFSEGRSLPVLLDGVATNANLYNQGLQNLSALMAAPIYLAATDKYWDIKSAFGVPYKDRLGNLITYRFAEPNRFVVLENQPKGSNGALIDGNVVQIPNLTPGQTYQFNLHFSAANGVEQQHKDMIVSATNTNARPWWAQNGALWSWQGAGKTRYVAPYGEDVATSNSTQAQSLVTGNLVNASGWTLVTTSAANEVATTAQFGYYHDGLRVFGSFDANGVFTAGTIGNGTSANPYKIYYPAQLAYLANNPGSVTYYQLCADLNMGGSGPLWIPIGNATTPFVGNLNGGGFAVNNLFVNTTLPYAGLFGLVRNATIQSVGVGSGSSVTSSNAAASIGGVIGAIVPSVTNQTTLVKDCYNRATVFASASGASVGGVIGAVGSVAANTVTTTLNTLFNAGNIYSGYSTSNVGGIVGSISLTTNNTNSVTLQNGINIGVVESRTTSAGNFGAIVGSASTTGANPLLLIANVINNGFLYTNGFAGSYGGVVGYLNLAGTNATSGLRNALVSGVIRGSGTVGSIVGNRVTTNGVAGPMVWDRQMSPNGTEYAAVGTGNAIATAVTGAYARTTDQLKENGLNLEALDYGFERGNTTTLYWAKQKENFPQLVAFKNHTLPIFQNLSAFSATPITLNEVDRLWSVAPGITKNISTPLKDAMEGAITYTTTPSELVSSSGQLLLPTGLNQSIEFTATSAMGFSKTYKALSNRAATQPSISATVNKTAVSNTINPSVNDAVYGQTFDITLSVSGNNPMAPQMYDFVIVFDNSNSMYTNSSIGTAKSTMSLLIDEIQKLGTTADVQYGVVVYGTHAYARNFSTGTDTWSAAYANFTPSSTVFTKDYTKAKNAINAIAQQQPSSDTGGTNTQAGYLMVQKLMTQKRSGSTCIVIFMTDGVPTYHYPTPSTGVIGGSGSQTQPLSYNSALTAATTLAATPDLYVYNVGMLLSYAATDPAITLSRNLMGLAPKRSTLADASTTNLNTSAAITASDWATAPRYSQGYLEFNSTTTVAQINQAFIDLVKSFAQYSITGSITDIIPANFALSDAEVTRLRAEGATVLKNTPTTGQTTVIYPNVPLQTAAVQKKYSIVYVGNGVSDPKADYGVQYTNVSASYDCRAEEDGTLAGHFPFPVPAGELFPKMAHDYFDGIGHKMTYSLDIIANDPFKNGVFAADYSKDGDLYITITDQAGNPKTYTDNSDKFTVSFTGGYALFTSAEIQATTTMTFYYTVSFVVVDSSGTRKVITSPVTRVDLLVGTTGLIRIGTRFMVSYPNSSPQLFPEILLGSSALPTTVTTETKVFDNEQWSNERSFIEFVHENFNFHRFYDLGEEVPNGVETENYTGNGLDGKRATLPSTTNETGTYVILSKLDAQREFYANVQNTPSRFETNQWGEAILVVRPTKNQALRPAAIANKPSAYTGSETLVSVPTGSILWEAALTNPTQNTQSSGHILQSLTSGIQVIESELLPQDEARITGNKVQDLVRTTLGNEKLSVHIVRSQRLALANSNNANIHLTSAHHQKIVITVPYPAGEQGTPVVLFYPEKDDSFNDLINPFDYSDTPNIFIENPVSGSNFGALTVLKNSGTPTALQFEVDNLAPFVVVFYRDGITDAVAMIVERDLYYMSLKEAFATAQNSETVRLLKNVRENIAIADGRYLKFSCNALDMGVDVSPVVDDGVNAGALSIAPGGAIELVESNLKLNNLALAAYAFGKKAELWYGNYQVVSDKGASLDYYVRDAVSGTNQDPTYAWYPLTLPFEVDLGTGVTSSENSVLTHPFDYGVAEFDGTRRATNGVTNSPNSPLNDWQLLSETAVGTMLANKAYMVRTTSQATLRFKKSGTLTLSGARSVTYSVASGSKGSPHNGWNYVGQPAGFRSKLANNSGIIQVSESYSSDRSGINKQGASYKAINLNTTPAIAPYTAFFYQASAAGSFNFTQAAYNTSVIVRSYDDSWSGYDEAAPQYYEVRLVDQEKEQFDLLFVAANTQAIGSGYKVGRDVLKMGSHNPDLVQLWSSAYGYALCANEAILQQGRADIPLVLNMPSQGSYLLELANAPQDDREIWLLEEGHPIENLSQKGAILMQRNNGTQTHYALRIIADPSIPVGEMRVYGGAGIATMEGLPIGTSYRVIDLAGRIIASNFTDREKMVVSLSPAIYLIEVANERIKIVVH